MQLVKLCMPYLVVGGLFAGVVLVVCDIVRRYKGNP